MEKLKGDDEIVKSLHSLLFSSVSKKLEGKKNIRLFNGFADEKTKNEKLTKVTENKKKWTVQLLKSVLGLFGMEKTGTRNELVEKLMDYLMSPTAIKEESSFAGSKKKTAKAAPTKAVAGAKRKATNDGKAPKKARAPSAYILFSVNARMEIKEANPEATFAEIGALVGKKWNAIDEDEKKVTINYEKFGCANFLQIQTPQLRTFILQIWTNLAAEKAAAMKVDEEEAAEEGEKSKGDEGDSEDDDNDDDLFGNGDKDDVEKGIEKEEKDDAADKEADEENDAEKHEEAEGKDKKAVSEED